MRRLSVKQRVVLFTAMVLVLMAVLVFEILRLSSTRQAERYAAETLRQASQDALDEIELQDGMLVLDRDIGDIDYADILIYDSTGRREYYGPVPAFDAPLMEGEPRKVAGDGGSTWYVYDVLLPLDRSVSVWIRACLPMDSLLQVESHVHRVFLSMVLPLCALGILGGYLVTRRAFAPMARMAEAAERIAGGDDLGQRIGIESRDEFGKLSAVLDDMLSRLEAAFQQEKRFTADASHELRTPLTVIRAQCELGLGEGGDPKEALLAVSEQEKRLSRLVKDLLMLSRMDAGTQMMTPERVDLSLLMEAVAEELSPAAEERGVKIELDAAPDCVLMGDEMLLLRMLINLLENAVRFAKSRVSLALTREGDRLLCAVKDDGPGIAPDDLPHIFERFWQADSARGKENGSSGLGLSMVEWIVKAHGGKIQVESKPGEGAVFWIWLPLANA